MYPEKKTFIPYFYNASNKDPSLNYQSWKSWKFKNSTVTDTEPYLTQYS